VAVKVIEFPAQTVSALRVNVGAAGASSTSTVKIFDAASSGHASLDALRT
jgi:hypothetical protein